jgi:hypothetical protein
MLAQMDGEIARLPLGGDDLGAGQHLDVGVQVVIQESGRDDRACTTVAVV